MLPQKNNTPRPSGFVSPPPSVGSINGTELDAALAHLRPQIKRLLPHLPGKEKAGAKKAK